MGTRRKIQKIDDTANGEDDEPPFTLSKIKFKQLVEGCPEPGSVMLKRLFLDFFSQWSTRVNSENFSQAVINAFLRYMATNGVPIKCNWNKINTVYHKLDITSGATLNLLYKMPSPRNLKIFIEDMSRLETLLRSHRWFAMQNYYLAQKHKFQLGYASYRREYVRFVRQLNYRAMANYLSYSQNFRERRLVIAVPEIHSAFEFGFQVLLAYKNGVDSDISERIFELAQNAAKCTPRQKDSAVLAYLCESLIAVMTLGYWDAIGPIIALDKTLDKTSHYYKHIKTWRAYKLLAQYCLIKENVGNIQAEPKILAQELLEQNKVLESGTIFGEAAIRLLVSQEDQSSHIYYDDLVPALTLFAKSNPRRAENIIQYLRTNELDEEVDLIIENACKQDESNIHPSEAIWLDWCERRVVYPIRLNSIAFLLAFRYGPIEEVYAKVAKVLFSFLDFGTNRGNERAWRLLHLCLPNVERQIVSPLWLERSSWWPAFHRNKFGLSREVRNQRSQILSTLKEEISWV